MNFKRKKPRTVGPSARIHKISKHSYRTADRVKARREWRRLAELD